MPHPKIHERVDSEIFGESYPEVHKWIDGTFDGTNGRTHWISRHYVIAIYEKFNPEDYPDKMQRERLIQAAKLHILVDWIFYYHRFLMPITSEDVVRELRSEGVFI